MAPTHIGQGSIVEYTVAPVRIASPCSRRSPHGLELRVPGHVALGVLSVLARRQHDAIAHEDRAHGPVASGKRRPPRRGALGPYNRHRSRSRLYSGMGEARMDRTV